MKHISLFTVIATIFLLLSCDDSTNKGLESLAKENLNKSVKTYFKVSDEVNLEELKTSYSDDSLCILKFKVKNKEDSSINEFEYSFMSQGGHYYYTFSDLKKDKPVFISSEDFDSVRHERAYVNLDYADALLHNSIKAIIYNGSKIGISERSFSLKSPSEVGLWDIMYNKDEFGDDIETKSIIYVGQGDYYDYKLYAGNFLFTLTISPSEPTLAFSLYEDHSLLVTKDGEFDLKVKDVNGKIRKFVLNSENGYIATWSNHNITREILSVISEEGNLSFILQAKDNASRTYKFIINTSGYKKAIK